jgi:hypothetical protein
MKKDNPEVSPRQKKLQATDSVASGGLSGNNGHEKDERSRVCNEVKVEVTEKPTVSLRRIGLYSAESQQKRVREQLNQ